MHSPMIKPTERDIPLIGGGTKKFIISKFPATVGREIVTQYPTSATPKIGDYKLNESLMLKLMTFVAAPIDGGEPIRLVTRELVDNHVPDLEALVRLEFEMLQYNTSFLAPGKISGILDLIEGRVGALLSRTLTQFAHSLSRRK